MDLMTNYKDLLIKAYWICQAYSTFLPVITTTFRGFIKMKINVRGNIS